MIDDAPSIKTSVSSSWKSHILMRGTIMAVLGAAIMMIAGIALPPETMSNWGAILFFIGLFLIARGLLPYRRLTKLELNPDQLIVSDGTIHFLQGGRSVLRIPRRCIEAIRYVEESKLPYGLAFDFQWPLPAELKEDDPYFKWMKRRRNALKYFNADLFLPYFSKRAYRTLMESL